MAQLLKFLDRYTTAVVLITSRRRPHNRDEFIREWLEWDLDLKWTEVEGLEEDQVIPPLDWPHTERVYAEQISMIYAVLGGIASGCDNLWVIPDWTVFKPDFKDRFPKFLESLPSTWGVLQLTGAVKNTHPVLGHGREVIDGLVEVRNPHLAGSLVIRGEWLDLCLGALATHTQPRLPRGKCHGPNPPLCSGV
jgi:hypothetical protein